MCQCVLGFICVIIAVYSGRPWFSQFWHRLRIFRFGFRISLDEFLDREFHRSPSMIPLTKPFYSFVRVTLSVVHVVFFLFFFYRELLFSQMFVIQTFQSCYPTPVICYFYFSCYFNLKVDVNYSRNKFLFSNTTNTIAHLTSPTIPSQSVTN